VAHTFTHLLYHVVFSTKQREPWIDKELQPRLYEYLGGITDNLNGHPVIFGGIADHVHMLLYLPPTLAVSDALRVLKANSSKWVHETFPDRRFAWQTGFGAFTVSRSQRNVVTDYISRQEAHHAERTFQEEFRELLNRHELEYDERYIWD
jgi:REP element-mobilizing transposase RayT